MPDGITVGDEFTVEVEIPPQIDAEDSQEAAARLELEAEETALLTDLQSLTITCPDGSGPAVSF